MYIEMRFGFTVKNYEQHKKRKDVLPHVRLALKKKLDFFKGFIDMRFHSFIKVTNARNWQGLHGSPLLEGCPRFIILFLRLALKQLFECLNQVNRLQIRVWKRVLFKKFVESCW